MTIARPVSAVPVAIVRLAPDNKRCKETKRSRQVGVDLSHGDVHFSYRNFNCFRRKLALEICVEPSEMEGFGGETSWDEIQDPLVPLLSISDCGGEISPQDCPFVANRLMEIVTASPDAPQDYWKVRAIEVAEAMQIAADKGQVFRLC